jgi:ParB-like chromosome segregation protein Spo0J
MKVKIDNIRIGNRYRKDMGDLNTLANSIQKLGLLQPVVIDQANNLIAGRRRIEAVKTLGWTSIDCRVVDIPAIILGERDENAVRKPFAPSEMVAIANAIEQYEARQAKQRQGTRTDLQHAPKLGGSSDDKKDKKGAKGKAAKAVGTSAGTLEKAQVVVKAAEEEPEKYGDLVTVMDEGSPTKAVRELNKRKRQEEVKQMDELPNAKYRVLYVDPPWHYDNKGMMDNYGHAERHYATMTVQELCEMPIKDTIEDNAVLFLWVTSPILPDAFPVINAWGFTYKTMFVWDKVKHNSG